MILTLLSLTLLPVPALAAPALADGAPAAERASEIAGGQTVDNLVDAGRDLLRRDRPLEAEVLFERAVSIEDSLRTRTWLIRSWMQRGEVNRALNSADDLAERGARGTDLDYLYGMGFYFKAKKNMRDRADLGVVGMSFDDSRSFLQTAVAADPQRYWDAFLPLAEVSWNGQRNEQAREAIERAIDVDSGNAEAWSLLGRIAQSQYQLATADTEHPDPNAEEHFRASVEAFARAIELMGAPEDPGQRTNLANVHVQKAYAHVRKQELEQAAADFGSALTWDPSAVDFGVVRGYFEPAAFTELLEAGVKGHRKLYGKDVVSAATPLWWLGWTQYTEAEYEAAEAAFLESVALWPAYTNAMYYIALSRYHQRSYGGAIDSLIEFWQQDPAALVATIEPNQKLDLSIISYLVGHANKTQRFIDAGTLSEIQAGVAPRNPDYWNNAGLFYRDGGDHLRRSGEENAQEKARPYFEKSLECYEAALALSPDDPVFLNDTAVILHYYLGSDLDRAAELYRRAMVEAEKLLAGEDLTPVEREGTQVALRDARNNLARLEGRAPAKTAGSEPSAKE